MARTRSARTTSPAGRREKLVDARSRRGATASRDSRSADDEVTPTIYRGFEIEKLLPPIPTPSEKAWFAWWPEDGADIDNQHTTLGTIDDVKAEIDDYLSEGEIT